jgi:hypothetical protein
VYNLHTPVQKIKEIVTNIPANGKERKLASSRVEAKHKIYKGKNAEADHIEATETITAPNTAQTTSREDPAIAYADIGSDNKKCRYWIQ